MCVFLGGKSDNLYTLGSVVSVPPLLFHLKRGGGAFIVSVSTHQAPGLFISFFIEVDVVIEHKARPRKKGRTCELMLWSERLYLPVNLYYLFFCYV